MDPAEQSGFPLWCSPLTVTGGYCSDHHEHVCTMYYAVLVQCIDTVFTRVWNHQSDYLYSGCILSDLEFS